MCTNNLNKDNINQDSILYNKIETKSPFKRKSSQIDETNFKYTNQDVH